MKHDIYKNFFDNLSGFTSTKKKSNWFKTFIKELKEYNRFSILGKPSKKSVIFVTIGDRGGFR